MDYIKNTLLENEKIIYYTGPHWIIFGPAAVAFGFLLCFLTIGPALFPSLFILGYNIISIFNMGLFLVLVYQLVVCYARYVTSEYGVTNQRIITKAGFIRRYSLEILLKRVESIQVAQSITGRVFNYGTVLIRGTGGSFDAVDYIPNPLEFRKMAQQQITNS